MPRVDPDVEQVVESGPPSSAEVVEREREQQRREQRAGRLTARRAAGRARRSAASGSARAERHIPVAIDLRYSATGRAFMGLDEYATQSVSCSWRTRERARWRAPAA